jgi:hypothetical protein
MEEIFYQDIKLGEIAPTGRGGWYVVSEVQYQPCVKPSREIALAWLAMRYQVAQVRGVA